MMHEVMVNGFEEAITNKYLSDARKNEVKRGKKVGEVFGFKKEEGDENSLPEEPSSYEWDNASDYSEEDDDDNSSDDYSGGEENKEQANTVVEANSGINTNNQNTSDKPKQHPLLKPKVENKKKPSKSCFSKLVKSSNKIETVTLKYPKTLPKLSGGIPKPVAQNLPNSFKEDGESSESFQYILNK